MGHHRGDLGIDGRSTSFGRHFGLTLRDAHRALDRIVADEDVVFKLGGVPER